MTIKRRLVKSLVFPVATNGAETWTLGKAMKAKIAAFEMWCWRRMLRVSWKEKRSNASILDEVKEEQSLKNTIEGIKLTYCARRDSRGQSCLGYCMATEVAVDREGDG